MFKCDSSYQFSLRWFIIELLILNTKESNILNLNKKALFIQYHCCRSIFYFESCLYVCNKKTEESTLPVLFRSFVSLKRIWLRSCWKNSDWQLLMRRFPTFFQWTYIKCSCDIWTNFRSRFCHLYRKRRNPFGFETHCYIFGSALLLIHFDVSRQSFTERMRRCCT